MPHERKNTMLRENKYRTHYCGEIREDDIGKSVRVAGWVENIRDHGGVMFLDIRDHYGVVQVVVHDEKLLENINKECTVTVSGNVTKRDEDTINPKIATGTVEIHSEDITVPLEAVKNPERSFTMETSATKNGSDMILAFTFREGGMDS